MDHYQWKGINAIFNTKFMLSLQRYINSSSDTQRITDNLHQNLNAASPLPIVDLQFLNLSDA